MKNLKYYLFANVAFMGACVNMEALDFGQAGNISPSMGGAGVALKDSPYGLYYNPALIGADNRMKFGYSASAALKTNRAIMDLITKSGQIINTFNESKNTSFDDLLNLGTGATSVSNTSQGASSTSATNTSGSSSGWSRVVTANILMGATGNNANTSNINIIKDTLDSMKDGTQDYNKFLQEVSNGKITNQSQLKTADEETLEKVKEGFIEKVKQEGEANNVNVSLLTNMLENIDEKNLGTFLDKITTSTATDFSVDKIMEYMGGKITFKKSDNQTMAQFLDTIDLLLDIMKYANVKANAYTSAVFQMPVGQKAGIAFGVFGSARFSAGVILDPSHSALIMNYDNKYYEITQNDEDIVFSKSDKSNYDSRSLLSDSAKHNLYLHSLALTEYPIGYSKEFGTIFGDISIGVAAKYMQLFSYANDKTGALNNLAPDINFNNMIQSGGFGIDVGLLYSIKNLSFGLVGKNLNYPTFKSNFKEGDFTIKPQVRAGLGYKMGKLTLAFDADLTKNQTITPYEYSQFVGGGVMYNFSVIDLRLGLMQDVRSISGEGLIFTTGVNVLGLFDIALQSNFNLANVEMGSRTIKMPSYFALNIGGSFSF